jgi:LytR cell envelope-related transcriptional attenuator
VSPGSHASGDGSFGRSAGIQAGRAALLIVVAVLIGFVLLHRIPGAVSVGTPSTGSGFTLPTVKGSSSTPTIPSQSSTPTTSVSLRAPSSVKVLVANGTSTAGLASRISTALHTKGYDTLTAVDSTVHPTATIVYFQPGYGPDAAALAGKLNLPSSAVQAMAQPPPVGNLSTAEILVVVGPDLNTGSSTTATT